MPLKRLFSAVILACLCRPASAAEPGAGASSAPDTLPPEIRKTLNEEYPGWKPAPVTNSVKQEFAQLRVAHPPSFLWADFDHDNRRDYAVQIALSEPGNEEQIVIVFMNQGNSYQENIVQSTGLDPTMSLWAVKKQVDDGAGPHLQDTLVVRGGPLGETTYRFENGQFHDMPGEVPPVAPPE